MSRPWVHNEDGPDCHCGDPTVVKVDFTGEAVLLCLLHTSAAGALCRLPEQAPDNWAELTIQEVVALA